MEIMYNKYEYNIIRLIVLRKTIQDSNTMSTRTRNI